MLTEAFSYDADRPHPTDTVHEIVDSWVPVYYHDIRQAWIDAGCPEPEEGLDTARDIHHAMQLGLYMLGHEYAYGMVWRAHTHAEALEMLEAEGVTA